MKRILLIDSHAIIHRAYHALPPLSSPSGEPTNAVYGFTTILLRMVRELKPDYIAAAFDLPGPTFRHEAYAKYKAHRPATPDDLASQFTKVKEILDAFEISVYEKPGFEADDIIATLTAKFSQQKECEIMVVTGDMDALQLVAPKVRVYAMRKGISDMMVYDEDAVRARYGVSPRQMADIKALQGDVSDNIPGVKGIGEKTAKNLIQTFGNIKRLYAALAKKNHRVSASVAQKLIAGKEDALLSYALALLVEHVPLSVRLEDLRWRGIRMNDRVASACERFGFFSLLKRLSGEAAGIAFGRGAGGDSQRKGEEAKRGAQGILLAVAESPRFIRVVRVKDEFLSWIKDQDIAWACLPASNTSAIPRKQDKRENSRKLPTDLKRCQLFAVRRDGAVARVEESLLAHKDIKHYFSAAAPMLAYDAKGIARLFLHARVEAPVFASDIMLGAYAANVSGRDFSYLGIASRELGRMVSASAEELPHLFEISKRIEEKIIAGGLERVYRELELPLAPVLAAMEERGVMLDKKVLGIIGAKVDKELARVSAAIFQNAGEEFNINSSQQLSRILFEKLNINAAGLRKTEKGRVISTRESELEKLKDQHPMIARVLDYRELMKLKTTYIDALPLLIDARTGRLHTTFNQTGTSTGRLSSSNPNLQNIPIMSEYGREIRKAFVVEEGFLLITADYSQIELRVAAHLAGDEKMIAAFRAGADIHSMTAAAINNVAIGEVTAEMRRAAKTLNFGVLYGMGPVAFAEATGVSREKAEQFIDDYFSEFSGVAQYIEATKIAAAQNGFVATLWGRRRYIPEINASNWQLKREAERMAVNMPIQGTAADLVKLAMIRAHEWIRSAHLQEDARLILQVHDELIFEVRESASASFMFSIKELMEQVVSLAVPLVADVHTGRNWGEVK